ncbi:hypothetical protein [Streptomyces sp. MNU89]|uniref:hypothetical protein n=1 Tax=Streptomyces sp. MNU89 TaxID=2560025 RepID=UPI001001B649|nr:hypothetical protein [Streptomyces sp. MNU89]MCC9743074.1 hypothetical protein [Streptomyces sp. MNU89]
MLAGLLAPLWPHAAYLSCRRNMTVVLRDTREDVPSETGRGAEAGRGARLSRTDEAVLALQRLRLARAADFRVAADPPEGDADRAVPRTPEQLDAEMARRWPEMLAEVRAHAEAAGADASAVGTREFYRRREVAVPTTLELARRGHPAAALLPTVAAALTFGGDTSLGWYGDWIAEEAESLAAEHPEWLTRTALPQALAMAANPLVPEWSWTNRLLKRTSAVTAAS